MQESERTLERHQQEQIAKVYIGAFAMVLLQDKLEYADLLRDYHFGVAAGWLPADIELVSQYQDPHRRFIQHFEEPGANLAISNPVMGKVELSSINAKKQSFFGNPTQILYQETQGLRLDWNGTNGVYRIKLDPETLDIESFKFLGFRIGQSKESNNPIGREHAVHPIN